MVVARGTGDIVRRPEGLQLRVRRIERNGALTNGHIHDNLGVGKAMLAKANVGSDGHRGEVPNGRCIREVDGECLIVLLAEEQVRGGCGGTLVGGQKRGPGETTGNELERSLVSNRDALAGAARDNLAIEGHVGRIDGDGGGATDLLREALLCGFTCSGADGGTIDRHGEGPGGLGDVDRDGGAAGDFRTTGFKRSDIHVQVTTHDAHRLDTGRSDIVDVIHHGCGQNGVDGDGGVARVGKSGVLSNEADNTAANDAARDEGSIGNNNRGVAPQRAGLAGGSTGIIVVAITGAIKTADEVTSSGVRTGKLDVEVALNTVRAITGAFRNRCSMTVGAATDDAVILATRHLHPRGALKGILFCRTETR